MSAYLLDVSVLIALFWPSHRAHAAAQEWFRRHSRKGWATCPLTQAGCIRILANPAFAPGALRVEDAVSLVAVNLHHPTHEFWADDLPFAEAVAPFERRIHGHRQITDAYLLGLALHRKGHLVTLDRRIGALLPEESAERHTVVEISVE